jgi:flagellar hook protein FlgE
MYSGISGLSANSTALTVIGNNIANINTPAFKVTRPEFSDILSKTMNLGQSVGRGTQIESVSTMHVQGGFTNTANVTDMALEGKGFFIARDVQAMGIRYTRAGNFHIDDEGYMVTPAGYRVQGFDIDSHGKYTGTEHDIQVNTALLNPAQTTTANYHINLSSNEEVVPAFDVNDIENTSNFSSSITVYDSLGNGHQVTMYFSLVSQDPTTGSVWDYNVVVSGDDWEGGTTGDLYVGATGQLTFDNQGRLDEELPGSSSFNFSGGPEQAQNINFDFGTSITTDGGTGLDGTTQYGESNATLFQSQDGYGPSYLEALDVDQDGRLFGKYGNGEIRYFAQIAIANFSNPSGLDQVGGNMFAKTITSGEPVVSVANVAGNGRIFGNTLEQSNVDLAEQFVSMIITQRGFQANARSIQTSDQMMNELVNVVR